MHPTQSPPSFPNRSQQSSETAAAPSHLIALPIALKAMMALTTVGHEFHE
jgi:hypothetical protein